MKRRAAWILILIVDAGFVAWGAMAAAFPDYLLGPGGKPILTAGYEGYTGGAWPELVASSPKAAGYCLLFSPTKTVPSSRALFGKRSISRSSAKTTLPSGRAM